MGMIPRSRAKPWRLCGTAPFKTAERASVRPRWGSTKPLRGPSRTQAHAGGGEVVGHGLGPIRAAAWGIRHNSGTLGRERSTQLVEYQWSKKHGGEAGIRTLGTVASTHAFQACSLSHSDTSPDRVEDNGGGRVIRKVSRGPTMRHLPATGSRSRGDRGCGRRLS